MRWSFSLFRAVLGCLSIRAIRAMCLTLALCAFGLSWVSDAYAAAPQTMYRVRLQASPFTFSAWFTTKAAACAALNPQGYPGVGPAQNDTMCFQPNGYAYADIYVGTMCGDGSAPNTSKPLSDQCGPPPPTCPAAGQTSNADHYTVTSDAQLAAGVNFCIPMTGTSGGCGMIASGRVGGKNLTTGKWEYQFMGPLTTTGQVCSGNPAGATDPVQDQPIKCSAGMCTGTVNGVSICVKCVQTDNATAGKVTTTNPDGSTTQTSTATTTTVNNNNVTTNVVTTTTTTPAGGGTPTTTTKTDANTESKDSFCSKNPNDPVCKKSLDNTASGGDDCNTPPSCSGDAIQCMMVQQQWKSRCDMQKTDDATAYGVQLTTGQDPQASTLPTPSGATEVSMKDKYAAVDSMGVVAKCIPDVDISLPGIVWIAPTHITISTAPLCDMGKLFGTLNILGTLALCAYMLKGAF